METFFVDPPEGSTPGVTIEIMCDGPLAGRAVIAIPGGGVLGWDTHEQAEEGIVLDGKIEVVMLPGPQHALF